MDLRGAAALLLVAGLSSAGCSSSSGGDEAPRSASSPSASHESADYPDLQVGDCYDQPALFEHPEDYDGTWLGVEEVPCTDPHQFEIFDSFRPVAGDDYPGDARLARLAQRGCTRRFEAFVGSAYRESSLEFYYSASSANQWRAASEARYVTCTVFHPEEPTTGSLEGSGL